MDGVEIIDMWDWMDFARTNYFIFAPVCTDRADCTPVYSTMLLQRTNGRTYKIHASTLVDDDDDRV